MSGASFAIVGGKLLEPVMTTICARPLAGSVQVGIATLPSRTNFVCFDLGTRALAESMVTELMRRAVFIRKPWAPPLDRYVRITVGTAAERERFAGVFAQALEALGAPALARSPV